MRSKRTLFAVVGHFGGATRGYPGRGAPARALAGGHQYEQRILWRQRLGNDGGRMTEDIPADGFSQSIDPHLPPLSTLIFKWEAET